MKTIRTALLFAAVLGGVFASTTADARWGHRGRIGVFIGAPVAAYSYYAWPRYYYPPPVYYAPPPVVVSPPTYIEQTPPPVAAPSAAPSAWYYCRESNAYYPNVQTCPSPWQQVAPQS